MWWINLTMWIIKLTNQNFILQMMKSINRSVRNDWYCRKSWGIWARGNLQKWRLHNFKIIYIKQLFKINGSGVIDRCLQGQSLLPSAERNYQVDSADSKCFTMSSGPLYLSLCRNRIWPAPLVAASVFMTGATQHISWLWSHSIAFSISLL